MGLHVPGVQLSRAPGDLPVRGAAVELHASHALRRAEAGCYVHRRRGRRAGRIAGRGRAAVLFEQTSAAWQHRIVRVVRIQLVVQEQAGDRVSRHAGRLHRRLRTGRSEHGMQNVREGAGHLVADPRAAAVTRPILLRLVDAEVVFDVLAACRRRENRSISGWCCRSTGSCASTRGQPGSLVRGTRCRRFGTGSPPCHLAPRSTRHSPPPRRPPCSAWCCRSPPSRTPEAAALSPRPHSG